MGELRVTDDDLGPNRDLVAAGGEIDIRSAPSLQQRSTDAIDQGSGAS